MQIVWSNQDLILMVSGFLTTSDLRHRHLDRDLWRLASWFLLGRRFIEIKPEKISPPTKTIVCKKNCRLQPLRNHLLCWKTSEAMITAINTDIRDIVLQMLHMPDSMFLLFFRITG